MSNVGQVNPFFTPTQISGCGLWLDAADTSTFSLSGVNVIRWRDKASSIVFTTQGTVANAILLQGINNKQCLYFDNSTAENVYMSAALSSRITGSFFYVVQARAQSGDNYRPFATWFTGGGNFPAFGYIGSTGNNNTVGPYTTYIGPGSPTQIFSPNTNYLVFYGFNNGTTSVGVSGSNPTAGSQGGFSAAGSTSTFWLGADGPGASGRVTLYYGEVLLYNSVLNTNERQQIEGYLAWKWGLQSSLPANHPYKSSPIPPLLSPPTGLPQTQTNPFFLPTQISGCAIWYDAADPSSIATTGIAVTQWNDKSGNGRNATRAANAATFYSKESKYVQINGNSPLSITNANNLVVSTSFSIFMVEQRLQSTENVMIGAAGLSTNNNMLVSYTGATGLRFSFFANNLDGTVPTYAPGESPRVISLSYFKPNRSISWNGSVIASDTNAADVLAWASPTLGVNWFGAVYSGRMYEVIFYVPAVSQLAQRQQIEGYLAWKWGLQGDLPSNFPYKNAFGSAPLVPITNTPTGRGGQWNPLVFSNCQLWLDASKETRTGTITSIQDLTSNAYTGSIVSATVQQRYLNKLNVWYFPSYTLRFNAFPWRTRFTVIFLLNTAGFAFTSQRVGGTGSYITYFLSNNCYLFTVNGYGTLYGNDGSAAGSCGPDRTPKNQWVIMVFAYNGGTLPSFYRFNGVNRTNVNSAGAGASDTTITDNMAINGSPSSTTDNASNTYYAEHIHYNAGLSLAQIETVEGYLAWKWGLQGNLPANHPFKKWPPAP
jgi:hypothetical protein